MKYEAGTLAVFKVLIILLFNFYSVGKSSGKDFYVTADSSQKGIGTLDSPFNSLIDAQKSVREMRMRSPNEPISVWLLPGVYKLSDSFVFTSADSGTFEAPIVWKSLKPGLAKLSGALPVDSSLLKEVSDIDIISRLNVHAIGHIKELDLNLIGLKGIQRFPDRFSSITGFLNLFYGGEMMSLSRWPNKDQGYDSFDRVLDSGSLHANDSHGATVIYHGDRPERWIKSLLEEGVWLRGFWRVPWVIEGLRVKSIDTTNHSITFTKSTAGGVGSKYSKAVNGNRIGSKVDKWYALNLIEEIDQPGEWAVSFKRNKLYFWPPKNDRNQGMLISSKQFPLILIDHAMYINFEGIVFEQTLGDGIDIIEGKNITIGGCKIRDVDLSGVNIKGGSHHSVVSCEIFNTGQYGIDFTGGNRTYLTPGLHEIDNNNIHDIGLSGPYPAIRAGEGTMSEVVGNHITHNRIHDCPNAGIRYSGNDNIIEYNEVYRVGMDSGDLGAFYTNSGWTSQGNILRYNLVHHSNNAQGFYLDDGDCGDTITHNIVIGASSGVFIGGGSDIIVDKNILINCDRAIHIDARGKSRGYNLKNKRLSYDLYSVPFTKSPWSEKYPHLAEIESRDTSVPNDVYIQDNYALNCKVGIRKSAPLSDLNGVHFGSIYVTSYVFSKNFYKLDFNSNNLGESKIIKLAFLDIPWQKIGLYEDEFIHIVPDRDWEVLDSASEKKPVFDSQIDVNASNHI